MVLSWPFLQLTWKPIMYRAAIGRWICGARSFCFLEAQVRDHILGALLQELNVEKYGNLGPFNIATIEHSFIVEDRWSFASHIL